MKGQQQGCLKGLVLWTFSVMFVLQLATTQSKLYLHVKEGEDVAASRNLRADRTAISAGTPRVLEEVMESAGPEEEGVTPTRNDHCHDCHDCHDDCHDCHDDCHDDCHEDCNDPLKLKFNLISPQEPLAAIAQVKGGLVSEVLSSPKGLMDLLFTPHASAASIGGVPIPTAPPSKKNFSALDFLGSTKQFGSIAEAAGGLLSLTDSFDGFNPLGDDSPLKLLSSKAIPGAELLESLPFSLDQLASLKVPLLSLLGNLGANPSQPSNGDDSPLDILSLRKFPELLSNLPATLEQLGPLKVPVMELLSQIGLGDKSLGQFGLGDSSLFQDGGLKLSPSDLLTLLSSLSFLTDKTQAPCDSPPCPTECPTPVRMANAVNGAGKASSDSTLSSVVQSVSPALIELLTTRIEPSAVAVPSMRTLTTNVPISDGQEASA